MKKKLITSALPYVNNVPHLGNIIGCVLSADVYARFCRLRGYDTLYVCGTDEYGTATENRAREEGLTPRQICDKYFQIHKGVYEKFQISFDVFGRTCTPEQTETAQGIFLDLEKNGYISEQTSRRTYCPRDRMFLADRYVEGTCPHCGSDQAKGDQCEACGSLLEPEKLQNARCAICKTRPVLKPTTHLYLDLDKLQPRLEGWFEKVSREGHWTTNAVNTTRSWLQRGLEPRPITRDLKWGIPVPRKGFENKVFYVWFDAPIGYISITRRHRPDWEDWWMKPDQVELYQFMAKDNIPFHTVLFPASLMGTGKSWTLLSHINSTEYLNYEDLKFSKSRGIGVFGTDIPKTGIPVDLWRFYLLAIRPESTDTFFSWKEFYSKVNYEFIDNIGNLINRVLVYLAKNFGGRILPLTLTPDQSAFVGQCRQRIEKITEHLEAVHLRESLRQILLLAKSGNKFFQDSQPWGVIKENPSAAHATISLLVYLIRNIGILLYPFMPATAEALFEMLNFDHSRHSDSLWDLVTRFEGMEGVIIGRPRILYPKLEMTEAEKWRKRFSGEVKGFSILNVVVGRIKEVGDHPNADRLYILNVDLGPEGNRTLCAGLVNFFRKEELVGQKVLVLTNLKPVKLRGQLSEGMILTAEDGEKIDLYNLQDFPVGTRLQADHQGPPSAEQIDIDDFTRVEIEIREGRLAWEGRPLLFGGKPLLTRQLTHGKVR